MNTLYRNLGKSPSCLLSGSPAATTSAHELCICGKERSANALDKQLPRALVLLTQMRKRTWPRWVEDSCQPRLTERVLPRHGGTRAKENESKVAIIFGCFSERVWEWFSPIHQAQPSHVPSQVPLPLASSSRCWYRLLLFQAFIYQLQKRRNRNL